MTRILTLAYCTVSYASFVLTFLYAIGFLGNFGVPKSLDSGATDPWPTALAIDLGLLSLFALQHSIMARQGFKRLLTHVVPAAAERSTYVLASSLALLLLFSHWRPVGGEIWNVQNEIGRALLYGGFAFGWLLVLVTTFVINHFDLFGLRQVWLHFRGQPQRPLQFVTPILYRIVRHPLYVGWLCTFWSTPTMTVTHLLFALVTSAYTRSSGCPSCRATSSRSGGSRRPQLDPATPPCGIGIHRGVTTLRSTWPPKYRAHDRSGVTVE